MDRTQRMEQLNVALKDRGLIWFGPRGSDALGLKLFTDNLGGAFSLYDRHFSFDEFHDSKYFISLEEMTLKRRLSRVFGEDDESRAGEFKFAKRIDECFQSVIVQGRIPTVIAYEPHDVIDTLIMQDGVAEYLGIGVEKFRDLSKKPRMEKHLRQVGVPLIPWMPVKSFQNIRDLHETYPSLIIRRDGGSSGKGIVSLRRSDDIDEIERVVHEMKGSLSAAVSVAPLFEGAISLNASAVVFAPKSKTGKPNVSTFPINAQLVGQPELTSLEFGYSGNDFAFAAGLDNEILRECDAILHKVGEFLGSNGYVGAFGVDFILTQEGKVLFTEVNPRFQGSTRLLTRIAGRAGQADVLMEHMAATLGLPFEKSLDAPAWADVTNPFSQMYLHNTTGHPVRLVDETVVDDEANRDNINAPVTKHVEYEMMPDSEDIRVDEGALLERIVVRGGVLSSDGRTLRDNALKLLDPSIQRYEAADIHPIIGRGDDAPVVKQFGFGY